MSILEILSKAIPNRGLTFNGFIDKIEARDGQRKSDGKPFHLISAELSDGSNSYKHVQAFNSPGERDVILERWNQGQLVTMKVDGISEYKGEIELKGDLELG